MSSESDCEHTLSLLMVYLYSVIENGDFSLVACACKSENVYPQIRSRSRYRKICLVSQVLPDSLHYFDAYCLSPNYIRDLWQRPGILSPFELITAIKEKIDQRVQPTLQTTGRFQIAFQEAYINVVNLYRIFEAVLCSLLFNLI